MYLYICIYTDVYACIYLQYFDMHVFMNIYIYTYTYTYIPFKRGFAQSLVGCQQRPRPPPPPLSCRSRNTCSLALTRCSYMGSLENKALGRSYAPRYSPTVGSQGGACPSFRVTRVPKWYQAHAREVCWQKAPASCGSR